VGLCRGLPGPRRQPAAAARRPLDSRRPGRTVLLAEVDDWHQPASARNALTSAANCLWCWKRKPWAASG
jgi:hypothetical protein